jgi:hypothetical protein
MKLRLCKRIELMSQKNMRWSPFKGKKKSQFESNILISNSLSEARKIV